MDAYTYKWTDGKFVKTENASLIVNNTDYSISVRAGAAAGTLIPEEKKPEPVLDPPAPVLNPVAESQPAPEPLRVSKREHKSEDARRRFEDRLSGLVKRSEKGRKQV